jgi:glycosyltransferase involved in cell wall biosynthesis
MGGTQSGGMKVLVNAVSAKLGGAATYVRNLARSLEALAEPEDRFVFVVPPERAGEMARDGEHVRVLESRAASGSYTRRWWWDQVTLRRMVVRERPDVLFSSANFAMMACPCPQALLVRIPIYFSREYCAHVLPAKPAAFRAETALRRWLVCRSVASADCVVTPSAAMLDDLQRHARIPEGHSRVIPYGVPRERLAGASPRRAALGQPLRVLWVSHYADHKDLGTLLRAVAIMRERGQTPVELWLTLEPQRLGAPRGQHTEMVAAERNLLAALDGSVRCLGVLRYEQIWEAYREADVFVFPSLCESFGHPLVEAMAGGLPVVASDIAVHREICANAAQYFPARDANALAARLEALAADSSLLEDLARRGAIQVRNFVWEDHVTQLLALLRELSAGRAVRAAVAANVA